MTWPTKNMTKLASNSKIESRIAKILEEIKKEI
jgi:hypothetical protein